MQEELNEGGDSLKEGAKNNHFAPDHLWGKRRISK